MLRSPAKLPGNLLSLSINKYLPLHHNSLHLTESAFIDICILLCVYWVLCCQLLLLSLRQRDCSSRATPWCPPTLPCRMTTRLHLKQRPLVLRGSTTWTCRTSQPAPAGVMWRCTLHGKGSTVHGSTRCRVIRKLTERQVTAEYSMVLPAVLMPAYSPLIDAVTH